jgi:hypothetical protein
MLGEGVGGVYVPAARKGGALQDEGDLMGDIPEDFGRQLTF